MQTQASSKILHIRYGMNHVYSEKLLGSRIAPKMCHLGIHPALGLVAELVEEGVVPPPGEGAGAVEAGGQEHRVTQGGHQLVPDSAAVCGDLETECE